jgi:hypothetical protein
VNVMLEKKNLLIFFLKRHLPMPLYLGMDWRNFTLELFKHKLTTYNLWNLKLAYLN